MNYERLYHGICRLGQYLYVSGGIDEKGFVNTVEQYDIELN